MAIEKHHMPVDGTWHDCPSCNHTGGWHVFFKRTHDPKVLSLNLQCPNCGVMADLGLTIQAGD